jgi:hypothetical protein
VVESESVFEFAVVVFDPPTDLGESDQLGQWGVGGQVGCKYSEFPSVGGQRVTRRRRLTTVGR